MNDFRFQTIADQLLADLKQERQWVDLMIQGVIEYRWAIGAEEQEIAKAMIYNAFEAYAVSRGIPLQQAEHFCERHLDDLIATIDAVL